MRRKNLRSVVVIGAAALAIGLGAFAVSSATTESGWALKGTWSDSCSCKVSCPCFFGSGPTEDFCEGSSLIEIEEGHYGGVELDGMAVVVSYRSGKWGKFYVADTASSEQADAVAALVPVAIPFLGGGPVESVEIVPVSVERTETMVKYSSPESAVEIHVVTGANGKPVNLENLPVKGLPFPEASDHVQYKAVLSKHHSEDHQFEWEGRNGFVSRLDLEGDRPKAAS
jgi:hypothetical protein